MSCPDPTRSSKDAFNTVTFRSLTYWFVCCTLAVIAVGAAEPSVVESATWELSNADLSTVHAVPEPGRALLLFVGIMAMAFTYRKAWLNWKRGEQN